MRDIGSRKQLFIDDAFFETKTNVRLVMNPPRKTDDRSVYPDKPWEAVGITNYGAVLPVGDSFYLYYMAMVNPPTDRPISFFGKPWSFKHTYFMCLARSADGIHWQRANTGLMEFDGSRENNIVWPTEYCWNDGGVPFLDTRPGIPEDEKFKMAVAWGGPEGKHDGGDWILKSPDGIHWSPLTDEPSFYYSDQGHAVFWDDRINKYVIYLRDNSHQYDSEPFFHEVEYANRTEILTNKAGRSAPHKEGIRYRDGAYRRVRRFETEDLRNKWVFEETTLACAADEDDPPGIDINNSDAQKYPWADNVYLMFPHMLRHFYHPPFSRDDPFPAQEPAMDAVQDIRLMTSRDGVDFRYISRQPFIPLGVKGAYDSGFIHLLMGMARKGADLYLYYSCRNDSIRHGVVPQEYRFKNKSFISRLVMRLDGFVSVDADNDGGEFTTPPMVFEGSSLELNVEASIAGYVMVELLQDGKPIEGYTWKDSDVIEGNEIDKTVTWNGRADVSALQGRLIQIRFEMRNAKLYAFQFKDA